MPAGNWYYEQNLDTFVDDEKRTRKRVEWPTGPLSVDPGDEATWVEAWVVQRSSGASQRSVQNKFHPEENRWIADQKTWVEGTFEPGPAMGIALLSTRSKTTHEGAKFFWWTDIVMLKD